MKSSFKRARAYSVAAILSMAPMLVHAATYHVRTNGSDTACNGSVNSSSASAPNCAYRTIGKGVNAASAGDTVSVHAGSYTSFSTVRHGNSSAPITIRASEGETVTVSRATLGHNYNVIRGFRITSSGSLGDAGIQVDGNYSKALYNTVLGSCRAAGGSVCAALQITGNNNDISYNTLDGKNNNENTSFTWGMHISGSNNQITHNTIKETNSIERVWELYGDSNRIANNEVKDVKWTIGNASHPDIIQVFGYGRSTNHIIENNYFHDFNGQLGNLRPQGGGPWSGWVFRNNIFANIKMEMFIWMPVAFYNNTFYNTTRTNTGWPLYVYTTGYIKGSVTSRNNAFIATGTTTSNGWFNIGNGDYDFVSHNANGGAKNGFSQAHGVNGGNPKLIAAATNCVTTACNFRVGADSALVNAGIALTGFTADIDGNTRQGSNWDIGAYEYTTAGQGSLNAPANLQVLD